MLVVGQQCAGTFCKMHHKLLLCFVCIHMQNGRLRWKYKTEAHYNVSYIYIYIYKVEWLPELFVVLNCKSYFLSWDRL